MWTLHFASKFLGDILCAINASTTSNDVARIPTKAQVMAKDTSEILVFTARQGRAALVRNLMASATEIQRSCSTKFELLLLELASEKLMAQRLFSIDYSCGPVQIILNRMNGLGCVLVFLPVRQLVAD
jgi:hypothetical protein